MFASTSAPKPFRAVQSESLHFGSLDMDALSLPASDERLPTWRLATCELDGAGSITRVNRSMIELSGHAESEWLGSQYFHWWHSDMPMAAQASLWDALQRNMPWRGLVKLVCRSGGYCWHDVYIASLRADAGHRIVVHNPPEPEMLAVAERLVVHCADLRRMRMSR